MSLKLYKLFGIPILFYIH